MCGWIAIENHHTIAGDGALKFPSAAEPIRIKILISRYILERGWGSGSTKGSRNATEFPPMSMRCNDKGQPGP